MRLELLSLYLSRGKARLSAYLSSPSSSYLKILCSIFDDRPMTRGMGYTRPPLCKSRESFSMHAVEFVCPRQNFVELVTHVRSPRFVKFHSPFNEEDEKCLCQGNKRVRDGYIRIARRLSCDNNGYIATQRRSKKDNLPGERH